MQRPSPSIRLAAWLAPATAVPSAAWRLLMLAGVYGDSHPVTVAMRSELQDVLLVSFGSVGLLSPTMSLVLSWSERFPRWLWPVAGNRVPPLLALTPACAGGILVGLALFALLRMIVEAPAAEPLQLTGTALVIAKLAYAPLMGSGLLVLLVARDYRLHRSRKD